MTKQDRRYAEQPTLRGWRTMSFVSQHGKANLGTRWRT